MTDFEEVELGILGRPFYSRREESALRVEVLGMERDNQRWDPGNPGADLRRHPGKELLEEVRV